MFGLIPRFISPTEELPPTRRLTRRQSFYDIDKFKSRNVEKFEKLETRLRCPLGTNKVTPRRLSRLLFKSASQPTVRVSTPLYSLPG